MDADLREARRRWERAPEDVATADAYAAALRRAGLATPLAVLERRRLPAMRVDVDVPVDITAAVDLDDDPVALGLPPRGGAGVDVPACSAWWFQPEGIGAREVIELARAHGAPHLELGHAPRTFDADGLAARSVSIRGPLSRGDWARVARVAGLEQLEVRSVPPGARTPLPPRLSVLAVERLDAEGLQLVAEGPPLSALIVGQPDPALRLPALRELRSLERLEALGVAWRGRPDDELPALTGWPLRRLKLAGPPDTSNAVVDVIARLERLEHLRLSQLPALTDAGVALLARLPLRTLHLQASRLSDDALDALSGCPSLERLVLDARCWPPGDSRLTDAGLSRLRGPALRELSLFAPRITGEGLAPDALPELQRLRLDLRGAEGAARAARLPRLEELDAGRTPLEPVALEALAGAPGLRSLRCSVAPPAFDALGRLLARGRLEELELHVTDVGPALVAAQARGAGLRRLRVLRPRLGRGVRLDVSPLGALERLEDLAVMGADVDPSTWTSLRRLERLRVVRHDARELAAVGAALPGVHAVARLPAIRRPLPLRS